MLIALPFSGTARMHLYSKVKADSLATLDSLKRTDSRWKADSTIKTRYFKSKPKKRTGFRLYSRSKVEQATSDSLRILDSLYTADSISTADSLIIARYQKIDIEMSNEKKAAEAAAQNQPTPEPVESIPASAPQYNENLSERTISIDPNNSYASKIDSLQIAIDHLNDSIHDNDIYLKKMKPFPVSEKQRYISFLLKNKMKTPAQLRTYCDAAFELYKVKRQLLVAIRNSQDNNTKSFISYHLKEHRKKMGNLSELILSLTPAVPFYPKRTTTTKKLREE